MRTDAPDIALSPFRRHVQSWKDCTACSLSKKRLHVVLARGKVPCQVLFVGEAPGASEDVTGRPFVGPAGKLLDYIIARALPREVSYLITNLVACIPTDETGSKSGPPLPEEISACSERLQEISKIANPRLVVCIGSLATEYLSPSNRSKRHIQLPVTADFVDLVHPAYILRANEIQRGLIIQRCIVTLRNAIDKFILEKESL